MPYPVRYAILAATVAITLLAGCPSENQPPFQIHVIPADIDDAIPGQACVFLVTVTDRPLTAGIAGPVELSASGSGAQVTIENGTLDKDGVAEITVTPDPLASKNNEWDGRDVTATLTARYGNIEDTKTLQVHVTSEEEDLVAASAEEVRDLFIPWLENNHPDLGITSSTEWSGTIVTPHILVVTHYLYFSDDWEMHVYWHVMIPPYDWARIELRRRFEDTAPSLAFEIPSRSATPPLEATAITPSETIWR